MYKSKILFFALTILLFNGLSNGIVQQADATIPVVDLLYTDSTTTIVLVPSLRTNTVNGTIIFDVNDWEVDGVNPESITNESLTSFIGNLILTMAKPFDTNAIPLVVYTDPNNGLTIVDAVNTSDILVVNQIAEDGVSPVVSSASTTYPTTIDITISETVTDSGVQSTDFTINGVASSPTVTNHSISGTIITLTLDKMIFDSDAPTVDFTQNASPNTINDDNGNILESFSESVINNVDIVTTISFTNSIFGFVDDSNDTRVITVDNGYYVTDVNVTVDFQKSDIEDCDVINTEDGRSYPEEISMSIESPSGTIVDLIFDDSVIVPTYERNTIISQRVIITFDDSASDVIGTTNNNLLELGTFIPEEALSQFNTEDPTGDWTFTFGDNNDDDYLCFYQVDLEISAYYAIVSAPPVEANISGSSITHLTKPTFGLYHLTHNQIVDGGFTFNGVSFDITDNWHTPFDRQTIVLGEVNTFSAKPYTQNKLIVQEFLFGIPEVGKSHKAELGIEIFYDYQGNVEEVNVVQKTNIIDVDSLVVSHKASYCQSDDSIEKCDTTTISVIFLEPLYYDVMAIKAVDSERRSQTTYLNEGFDISGDSLNPMLVTEIINPEKFESLVLVTQTAKYSNIWVAEDGREFERNNYGSFTEINKSYERHDDTGTKIVRTHTTFTSIKQYEVDRATVLLLETCPTCFESFADFEDSWSYTYPSEQRDRLAGTELSNSK